MPRKSGSKQKALDGRGRNVPARIHDLDQRLKGLEKGLAVSVEELAADTVPEIVRAELRELFVRWTDDLDPK